MIASLTLLPVRRATCALSAGPARATGWLVSAGGVLATSHAALGYRVDVDIENETGDRKPGRVVWVDVARDLALVVATEGLPRGPEPMVPLALREVPAPKVGDRVLTVAALAGRGLRIAPATICATPGAGTAAAYFDTDAAAVGPAGGPLLDAEHRAVGLLTWRSPAPEARGATSGDRSHAASGDRSHATSGDRSRAFAIPATAIRAALRSLDHAGGPDASVPVYRCRACAAPFVPEHDACTACGAPLPHAFPPDPARALSERVVRDALAAVGIVANRARTGPRSWQLDVSVTPASEPVSIVLALDEAGATAALRTPIVSVPPGVSEPFYRLLLTLNDQTTGAFRLALDGDRVVLALVLPVGALRDRNIVTTLTNLGEMSEHYRKILHEGFDAVPLSALDEPPSW